MKASNNFDLLDRYKAEVENLQKFLYIGKTITSFRKTNPSAVKTLNDSKGFWGPVIISLRMSCYLAVRRIFENGDNKPTVGYMIKFYKGKFLAPTPEIKKLFQSLDSLSSDVKKQAEPFIEVANKLFAHPVTLSEAMKRKFDDTNRRIFNELGGIIDSLWKIEQALRKLVKNDPVVNIDDPLQNAGVTTRRDIIVRHTENTLKAIVSAKPLETD